MTPYDIVVLMETSRRKLAAIMFTDIVGYSGMMNKDEEAAMNILQNGLAIQRHLVQKHHGQWLKEMGDGILVQFDTAFDAVKCAIDIQRASRADFEAAIRIGIHLGDVTVQNGDVFGDGVNLASRLESKADPGGIYISESVEKAIRSQSSIQTEYIGEFELKNIDYPVRTYAVQGVGLPRPVLRASKKSILHRKVSVPVASTLMLLGIFITLALVSIFRENSDNQEQSLVRSSIIPSDSVQIELIGEATVGVGRRAIDISNQGDKISFIGNYQGNPYVFIRQTDEFKCIRLPETRGAYFCTISPDGNNLVYFVGNSVRQIQIQNGSQQILAEVANPMDVIWDDAGTMYFSAEEGNQLYRYQHSAQHLDYGNTTDYACLSPLPGSQWAIAGIAGEITFIELTTGEIRKTGIKGTSAKYSPTGHIVYVRDATLTAVAFNKNTLELTSEPKQLIQGIRTETYETAQFDFSDDGILIYVAGHSSSVGDLRIVDRNNSETVLPFRPEIFGEMKFSPDENRFAIPVFSTNVDIWIYNLITNQRYRITNGGVNTSPVWMDENTLLFSRRLTVSGATEIALAQVNMRTPPSQVFNGGNIESISADGKKVILFRNGDLYLLDLTTIDTLNLTNTPSTEFHGSLSPNGKMLTYTSNKSRAFHVYLQHPDSGSRVVQLSLREGSEEPRWTADSKRIIYRSGQQWMEVKVLDEENLIVSSPEIVISGDYINISGFSFDITGDGEKMLVSKSLNTRTANEIKVIKGWFDELKERVPVTK